MQPGADVAEICQLAALRGMPVVFALTRIGLGSVFGSNKRMSGACPKGMGEVDGVPHVMQAIASMYSMVPP